MVEDVLQYYELLYYSEILKRIETEFKDDVSKEFYDKIKRLHTVLSEVIETPLYDYIHYTDVVDKKAPLPDGYYAQYKDKMVRFIAVPEEYNPDVQILKKEGDKWILTNKVEL